jgi:hypothetical protein
MTEAFSIVGVLQDGSTPIARLQSSQPVTIPQGTNATLSLTAYTEDGEELDLTGCTVTLKVRQFGEADPVLEKDATLDEPAMGEASFAFEPTDTEDLYPYNTYGYSVTVTDEDDNVVQIVPPSQFRVGAP